ncbi:hypothetical protein [Arthrobacter sp. SAFR-014]|uniref:hypothetical protein n=1 Tax=unclassified Arthrobacter TaxID=235627 RepID=UPI003F7C08A0
MEPLPPASAGHSLLEWLGVAIPALSAVTGLLFVFGWTYTSSRLAHFGVDHTILGLTTSDYVLRSIDAIYIPAAAILFLVLAALLLHAGVSGLRRRGRAFPLLRWAAITALAAGTTAAALGVWAMFVQVQFVSPYLVPSFLQGGGLAVATFGFFLLRRLYGARQLPPRTGIPRWEYRCYWLVVTIVVLNLFWASAQFASALGSNRALDIVRDLGKRPLVTVFSKQSLALSRPVVEETVASGDAAYRFKYTGLRLIMTAGGKYLLLSEGWTREAGTAVVLADSPDIRLEFAPGGVPR